MLPTGCDLIVQGVGAQKLLSNMVKLLQDAINSIQKDCPDLADVPVVAKQFSSRNNWTLLPMSISTHVPFPSLHWDPILNLEQTYSSAGKKHSKNSIVHGK
jgi:hypothetical protein